ncbi:glutamate--cysteine ligase [Rubellimicrobium sp. CFH 75288]|uniref:glutamate--cysteine ligase n=1 Tax=Rubellimicrobium sp. CFH 75288 TaxID=2697034 RepID=UPI00141249DE|nr:glutamate--cysteine ligase [Rubellimicrobium sp. CFH 75288]NAZ38287.1 glutamate--cysteine ligase [Rubellimicrobium sp. CFH 75288]
MSIPQSGGGPVERAQDLASWMEGGAKPREAWRIGTEHEKFAFLEEGLDPVPYEGRASVRALLEGLAARGWTEVRESGALIGLERGRANVSLEPGGQLELSGAPLRHVGETAAELDAHLAEARAVAAPLGIGFMALGAAPHWRHEDMPQMPKGRYRLMTEYMGRVGTHGLQMMYRTCTVQANLDFADEADMVLKLRVALALQPVATALFASSPLFEGRPNGHRSWRSRIWRDLDAARTGMLPWAFEEGMGFERYVDWALDVPMYFVHREGRYIDARGQSFRDFLAGRLPALPGEIPTFGDWADHLTTLFPEARVKRFVEVRGADAGDRAHLLALPAFWAGLLYHRPSLEAAWDLVRPWSAETREGLRVAASERALAGEAGGVRLRDLARAALALAEAGLAARAAEGIPDERPYLAPLHRSVETGRVQADDLLDAWEAGGVPAVVEAARL